MTPERVEHREARFAEPIEVGDVTITPLVEVRLTLRSEAPRGGTAALEPIGILIDGPDGSRALGLDGEELPMAGTLDPRAGEDQPGPGATS